MIVHTKKVNLDNVCTYKYLSKKKNIYNINNNETVGESTSVEK